MSGGMVLFVALVLGLAGIALFLTVVLVRYERALPDEWENIDDFNIYDKETTYCNCTVQVLENTATGEVSVGWWRNDGGAAENE